MSAYDYRRGLVQQAFADFGYNASPQEVDSLVTSIGSDNQAGVIFGEVGDYVQAHQQIKAAQGQVSDVISTAGQMAGDAQARAGQFLTQAGTTAGQGSSAYAQAANIYEQAPQLFGSMTPDQIAAYLAPLQTTFNYGLGQVQGAAAQRGLAGSSLEAQAMAQAQQQFQQNVLQQGLNVGMTQQQNRAQVLQALANQLFGQAGTQYNLASNQYSLLPSFLSTQLQGANINAGLSEDLAQLAPQLNALANSNSALYNQTNQSSGFGSLLGGGLGSGLGALLGSFGGPGGAMLGASLGGSLGGGIGSAITGNPAGANFGNAMQSPLFLGSLLANQRNGGTSGMNMTPMPANYTTGLSVPQYPIVPPNAMNAVGGTLLPTTLSL